MKSLMKSILPIGVIALLFAGCLPDPKPVSSEVTKGKKPTESGNPEYTVTAKGFVQEYKNNRISADIKYSNKLISISGVVSRIGKRESTGEYYIILDDVITCKFNNDTVNSATKTSQGKKVIIFGWVAGKSGDSDSSDVFIDPAEVKSSE